MAPASGNGRSRSPRRASASEAQITVRCPDEDCGQVYTVPAEYAGKRAKCTRCGTRTTIPATTATRPAQRPRTAATRRATPKGTPKTAEPTVRIGCIGRGHAGKTALFHALGDSLVGDFLPSGLHLDASDPREVARMIREAEDAQK